MGEVQGEQSQEEERPVCAICGDRFAENPRTGFRKHCEDYSFLVQYAHKPATKEELEAEDAG